MSKGQRHVSDWNRPEHNEAKPPSRPTLDEFIAKIDGVLDDYEKGKEG